MKKKIVLWGNDEADKKILIAIELKAEENKVNIHTFNELIATEEFYNKMMDDWRANKEVEFPEGHVTLDRPLSVTDDLLPETIKVQRTDLITRAKTEWHFAVLSSKLYEMYHSEVEDLKDKVDKLTDFDTGIWNELQGFWNKLNEQIRERNLFREQANTLRDSSNALFTQLKELRSKANAEFSKVSAAKLEEYKAKLNTINEKVEKGLGLKPIFEELKDIQNQFKDERFTKGDRNKLWKNIDILFKKVKEKKYGKVQDTGTQVSRMDRRYNGLLSAIGKMQQSIDRDQRDIDFQNKRVGETDGQLEAQIRQAKIKMIEGRIDSKNEKLQEMLATKVDLEKKVEKEKKREEANKVKREIQQKKKEVKEKIASEIEQKSKEVDAQKLEAAANAIKSGKKKAPKKEDSLLGAIAAVASETLEDVVDTVKAVGEVVGDKIEDGIDAVKEKVEDISEDISDAVSKGKNEEGEENADGPEKNDESIIAKGAGIVGAAAAAGGLLAKKAIDSAKDAKENISDKVESVKDVVTDKVSDVKEAASEKVDAAKETAAKRTDEVTETVSDKVEAIKETVSDKVVAAKEVVTSDLTPDESIDEVAARLGSSEEE